MTYPIEQETVARAILHAVLGDTDGGLVLEGDLPAGEIARLITEYGAAAAIAALPPSPAEEAVKRVEALITEAERVREHNARTFGLTPLPARLGTADLRAALASPAPAPQERCPRCGGSAKRLDVNNPDGVLTNACPRCDGTQDKGWVL